MNKEAVRSLKLGETGEKHEDEVEMAVKTIRDSFVGSEIVFMNGSCYRLFKILKLIFPDAEAYTNGDHVVTRVGERYYDIKGEAYGKFWPIRNDDEMITNKFNGHVDYIQCPNCDEAIKVDQGGSQ